MPPIRFQATPVIIGSWTVLPLPKPASAKLPSRGMVMAEGTINGHDFHAPLEPDGRGSHWFKIEKSMHVDAGDTAILVIEPMEEWPDPTVPADIKKGIETHPSAKAMWNVITPAARWDWIRWIRSTSSAETRMKRILVACSKMKAGERRPCCFHRNMCTEPEVAKSGVLLNPE